MNGLRNLVFNSLAGDQPLNGLGLTATNLYPAFSRDDSDFAMEGETFTVLRWNESTRGVGPVVPVGLDIWAYDINPDYSNIMAVLKRCRAVLEALVGAVIPGETTENGRASVNGVDWSGGSPDLFDPLYNRYTRSETYRIVASGS